MAFVRRHGQHHRVEDGMATAGKGWVHVLSKEDTALSPRWESVLSETQMGFSTTRVNPFPELLLGDTRLVRHRPFGAVRDNDSCAGLVLSGCPFRP